MVVNNNHLVEKRSVLNELRANNMTLQELRFFSIYLSKINARDVSTRVVRFPMADFQKIMEFGRLNMAQLRATTDGLLMQVVHVPIEESGGYRSFQLFKECTIDKDEFGEWYVEIDAHDKSLPLMFEFKSHYFTYELWNALRLKSRNQLRMYEILKQYEKVGERILTIVKLKELLGMEKTEYPRYDNLRVYVLNACQEALAIYTDICFTYEPFGKKGNGGKILQLKFTIKKNANYTNPLALESFIDLQPEPDAGYIVVEDDAHTKRINLLMKALNNEFSFEEVDYLNALISDSCKSDNDACKYLSAKYKYLDANKKKIKSNRYGYLRTIIETEIKNDANTRQSKKDKVSEMSAAEIAESSARMDRLLERQRQQIAKAKGEIGHENDKTDGR